MAEPVLTFAFNHDGDDTPWGYTGLIGEDPNKNGFMEIDVYTDLVVFTGGGIIGALPTPTTTSGSRDATIKPAVASYVIPQTFVEKDQMYHAPLTGHTVGRYAMAVHINGHITSNLYLEAWDDNSFSTTNLEVLTGTANNGYKSFINAISTTIAEPPWHPGWDGIDGAFLRGTGERIALGVGATLTDTIVYYNIYVRLETDCSTFHAQPVLGFRYLYT